MYFTNSLVTDRHVLVDLSAQPNTLTTAFCGRVLVTADELEHARLDSTSMVFLCGDVGDVLDRKEEIRGHPHVWAVEGHAHNVGNVKTVPVGMVPINVHGVGVFLRECFDTNTPYFERIEHEHRFQSLTESNKPGVAYRTGAYITPVEEADGVRKFHLLRCSSNFDGPTNDVQATDRLVLHLVNEVAQQNFSLPTNLNHILAQIYHNSNVDGREKKAVIKQHSDKTKDMPTDGLIAFCTFYRGYVGRDFPTLRAQGVVRCLEDPFDFRYRNESVLTKLRFRRKDKVERGVDGFDVPLYPNSLFLMPLDMNRLYTHEIVPSNLPIQKLPTRMGYVVRCAKTRAEREDGKTYLRDAVSNKRVLLREPTEEEMAHVKQLYAKENLTSEFVEYGFMPFTMNKGDLMQPIMGA